MKHSQRRGKSGVLTQAGPGKPGAEVERHPKLGASWEGYAWEQIIRLSGQERNCFFWASHGGAELDLYLPWHGKRFGFEFK